MAATISARWIEGGQLRSDGLEGIPADVVTPVWIDICDPDEAAFAAVSRRFPLPPLAVEDCLHAPQRPKLDTYSDVSFLIWLVPQISEGRVVATRELDVFLGEEHLITAHQGPLEAVERVAAYAGGHLGRGVEWTLHAILDDSVDEFFPVLDGIADRLEDLEDLMLSDAQSDHLHDLYRERRALVTMHKILGPERDVVRGLARLEAFVEPDAYMYFQDIGDHLARAADQVDTYREVASGTMDIYLSAQSNRMNLVMKQLTVVATIFMPLTLISGIYGMNVLVGMWPPADAPWSFAAIMAAMVLIALWMIWYFRRRAWW